MLIVDTHCHAGENWYEPIELLLYQMDANDVSKAVLVQHTGSFDNTYLLDCARRFPGRFRVVAMVDVSQVDAPSTLEGWAEQGVAGVRLSPNDRSPGTDPLVVWRKAAELGLVVSSRGDVDEFGSEGFRDLVGELPDLTIVIEHLAGAEQGISPPYEAFRGALELAGYPNTYIKVPGLGEISAKPPVLRPGFRFDYTPPLIEMTLEAFGPKRMMWGSDFPPVSSREGYRNSLRGVMDHPALGSQQDREWVMGRTATRAFGFR